MSNIKKWAIQGSTLIALAVGGYHVGEWNEDNGYPVIDTVTVVEVDTVVNIVTMFDTVFKETTRHDTVWFKDSSKLVEFATLGKSKLEHCVLAGETACINYSGGKLTVKNGVCE